jgi:hypothetical protein
MFRAPTPTASHSGIGAILWACRQASCVGRHLHPIAAVELREDRQLGMAAGPALQLDAEGWLAGALRALSHRWHPHQSNCAPGVGCA